ncbi:unnamed protein product [Amoebophrya sp. A120]|nr:unnamed protein product [Amoebophrya sp. A120]|eukprot:GSA120T00012579001.1
MGLGVNYFLAELIWPAPVPSSKSRPTCENSWSNLPTSITTSAGVTRRYSTNSIKATSTAFLKANTDVSASHVHPSLLRPAKRANTQESVVSKLRTAFPEEDIKGEPAGKDAPGDPPPGAAGDKVPAHDAPAGDDTASPPATGGENPEAGAGGGGPDAGAADEPKKEDAAAQPPAGEKGVEGAEEGAVKSEEPGDATPSSAPGGEQAAGEQHTGKDNEGQAPAAGPGPSEEHKDQPPGPAAQGDEEHKKDVAEVDSPPPPPSPEMAPPATDDAQTTKDLGAAPEENDTESKDDTKAENGQATSPLDSKQSAAEDVRKDGVLTKKLDQKAVEEQEEAAKRLAMDPQPLESIAAPGRSLKKFDGGGGKSFAKRPEPEQKKYVKELLSVYSSRMDDLKQVSKKLNTLNKLYVQEKEMIDKAGKIESTISHATPGLKCAACAFLPELAHSGTKQDICGGDCAGGVLGGGGKGQA